MKKTFSLIEILVAATIIGLLSAASTVTYSQFSKQSRDARRKSDLEHIRSALEMYRSNNDEYPAVLSEGSTLCDPSGCDDGKYLDKVPDDPRSSYDYYYSGSSSDYTLGAYLETGGTVCVAGQCGGNCNYCVGPYGEK